MGTMDRKQLLKRIFDYSTDEESVRSREGQGSNSFVSFARGFDPTSFGAMGTNFQSSSSNLRNAEFQTPGSELITDSDFFDSEAGKQLIIDDQASRENLFAEKSDVTNCDMWTICSRKNLSAIKFKYSKFDRRESVSIGELMGAFTEPITFSDSQKNPGHFEKCVTSTPIEKRRSFSLPSILDIDRKELPSGSSVSFNPMENGGQCISTPKSSIKPLRFSTPKQADIRNPLTDGFHYYIGTTASKNIQRLRNEEMQLQGRRESSLASPECTFLRVPRNSGASGSDSSTITLRSAASRQIGLSAIWHLEPDSIALDVDKGTRVRLINQSNKILRFKTAFDARMTSVCPASGTVPAAQEIGLRIKISTYAKQQLVSFEDDIKVVIENNEKLIHVKYVKKKSKRTHAERTYYIF